MKQLEPKKLIKVFGGTGGVVISPPPPTRGDEKVVQPTSVVYDSFEPVTLPVETKTPDEG